MGQRQYRRNARGQFAGSGGTVTMGKAGGFANASHRAKANNAKAAKAQRRALVAKGVKIAATIGVVAVISARATRRSRRL